MERATLSFRHLCGIALALFTLASAHGETTHFTCGVEPHERNALPIIGSPTVGMTFPTNWTIGTKRLLFYRVRFSDETKGALTDAEARDVLTVVSNSLARISYGAYLLDWTVTPLLELPGTLESYTDGRDRLLEDSRAAARAAGFNFEEYDLDLVRHNPIPGFMGGYGNLGQRGAWVQAPGAAVIIHEIGHNLGLSHANFWDTSGPSNSPKISPPFPSNTNEGRHGHEFDPDSWIGHETVIGLGNSLEYGDDFDIMGTASEDQQFNASYKMLLGWLPPENLATVTASGIYRIFPFDLPHKQTNAAYALRVARPTLSSGSEREYWVQFRISPTNNFSLENGVQIHLFGTGQFDGSSLLLDTTPGTEGYSVDSGLVIGRTLSDEMAEIHITPIARGGGGDQSWVDISVQFGPNSTNLPPELALPAIERTLAVQEAVEFIATAFDPNGDMLTYHWDFGDGSVALNTNSVVKSWKQDGEYVVRCEVSDTKGGRASKNLVVRVGEPRGFSISGHVTDELGNPVANARVHNGRFYRSMSGGDSQVFCFTDSTGAYTLPNLSPGSYTNGAFLSGYKIVPVGPYAPLEITDRSLTNIDFQAQPLPTVIVRSEPPFVTEGAPDSEFVLTRTGPTNAPLNVAFAVGGTAQPRSDYAGFFISRVTIPAGEREARLRVITFSDNEPEEPETITISLLHPDSYKRMVVADGQTNEVTFFYPGWELIPLGEEMVWAQTYPEFMPGPQSKATMTLIDSAPTTPAQFVSIHGSEVLATENPLFSTSFTIIREGSTNDALIVYYDLKGTAEPGVDFVSLPGVVTLAPGASWAIISIDPIPDSEVEDIETVIMSLRPDPSYEIAQGEASVRISDGGIIPTKLSVILNRDGTPKITLNGPAGTHILEQSFDLLHWLPIRTNLLFEGKLEINLPSDPSTTRYFRSYRP